ncbi:MAG: DJ-1/PfpI family protein [Paludibaculum sp.]
MPPTRNVVIVGAPPVHVLDVTGPLEVFCTAGEYDVILATPGTERVLRTHRRVALTEAVPISELDGPIDTLLVVGGPGAETGVYDPGLVEWLVQAAHRSRRVASICTGAFLLGAAGLLDGKQVVTHWRVCDRLAREFPHAIVRPDPIFIKDGGVYTSAGISAGIDLSLAMVEEDHGHEVALRVARTLVMFLVRPGGQSQFSHMLSHQAVTSKPLRELQIWMLEHLREDLTVETLADRIGMSPRHFTRICLRENPHESRPVRRPDAGRGSPADDRQLDLGLKEIADRCGFRTADAMRRTFSRVLGVTAASIRNGSGARFLPAPACPKLTDFRRGGFARWDLVLSCKARNSACNDRRNQMTHLNSSLAIPDSLLAREATRSFASIPPICFSITPHASICSRPSRAGSRTSAFDPELLYVSAAFHDLGLVSRFSSPDERFEVDGANAARQFLTAHNIPEARIQTAWQAIALHTTPGITHHMQPEVALLYTGVGLDVLGRGFDQFPAEVREAIVAKYPRKHFREHFLKTYFHGFAHKPETTIGTVNAPICERLLHGFQSPDTYDLIAQSPFPDSE